MISRKRSFRLSGRFQPLLYRELPVFSAAVYAWFGSQFFQEAVTSPVFDQLGETNGFSPLVYLRFRRRNRTHRWGPSTQGGSNPSLARSGQKSHFSTVPHGGYIGFGIDARSRRSIGTIPRYPWVTGEACHARIYIRYSARYLLIVRRV